MPLPRSTDARGNAPPRPLRGVAPLLVFAATLAATATATATMASPAATPAFTSGAITVERPWSRATPGGAAVAVGYLTIRNAGDTADRLVAITTAVAARATPHAMSIVGGVMEMRPLPDGIAVPPHGAAVLSPNGTHLMLEALKRPLKTGERFDGTLVFEHAGPVPVTFTVESVGAKGPGGTASDTPMKMNREDHRP